MVTTTRRQNKCSGPLAAAMVGSMLLTLANSVFAAPAWRLTPTLSVQESHTDNLNLEADNETSSFITQVTPGATLSKQGNKLKVIAGYQLQYLNFSSDAASDEFNHQLSLSSEAELIEDHFFIDANARFSQQVINRRDATTGDNLAAPDNRTDTLVFEIQPSWRQRLDTVLGKRTTVGLDFNLNALSYSNVDDDSDGYGINFFIDTRANTGKLYWSFDIDQRRADPDSSATQQSESVSATLGYRLSSKIEGQLRYGYVDNHLDTPTDSDADAGQFWGADLFLSPTRRTDFNLTYNSRLQGNSDRGAFFAHRQKHTRWSLSYREDVSSTRQELLQFTPIGALICPAGTTFSLADCTLVNGGETVIPSPDQQVITINAPLPSLTEERFIQTSTNANVVVSVRKSTWNLGVFSRERELQVQRITEEDTGFNASWAWRMSGRTSTQVQYSWSRLETGTLPTDYQRAILLSASRRLTPDSNLNLLLQHNERDSGDTDRDFDENRITLAYNRAF